VDFCRKQEPFLSHPQKYSLAFENAVAQYTTGNPSDRSEKTLFELYTKLGYAHSFFTFCERYFTLAGKKFIEVGCGTAYVSLAAAQRGATTCAVDVVEKALHLAAQRFREHALHGVIAHADLREPLALPQLNGGGPFEIVFCYQVLEHIPRRDQFTALKNLFRLVAPGGFLFIDTENSLCPYDRHDTHTWLVRLLSQRTYDPIIQSLGKGLNFFEPSAGRAVQTRDYLSYDELLGAAAISGFEIVNSSMPHEDHRQALRVLTGNDWLHDNVLQYFDLERFSPISVLFRRVSDA
jgi:2-polyprenyl-3-methyl-5-hydroxy-6-metoxy-1,4-benzoquinol methylase